MTLEPKKNPPDVTRTQRAKRDQQEKSSGTSSIPSQGSWVGSSALLIPTSLHTSYTEEDSMSKGI